MSTNDTLKQQTATFEAHGIDGSAGRPVAPLPLREARTLTDCLWLSDGRASDPDVHVAFRGRFTLDAPRELTLRVLAQSEFQLWVDGERSIAGPLRFATSHPEYQALRLEVAPGEHVLTAHVRSDQLTTRTISRVPGFLWCVLDSGAPDGSALDSTAGIVPVTWRCRPMDEYRPTGVRISPLLGWVEWSDRWIDPAWHEVDFDDEGWSEPARSSAPSPLVQVASRSRLELPLWQSQPITAMAEGHYRDTFTGYDTDDLAAQVALADLDPGPDDDVDGIWMRYDLGRVRIGTTELTVRTASGGILTTAYGERLSPEGRVVPVIPLSAGPTRFVQHHTVPPGASTVRPLQSMGGRWLEVRLRASEPEIVDAQFRERDVLGPVIGAFACGDDRLERIWQVGVDTLRASAEDALVDSVRERGEWLGDVITGAMELLAVSYGDLRLAERALVHAAATARPDGLVAGCGPGELIYLGTYAAQWITGCVRHAELTGDLQLLHDLREHARANLLALLDTIGPDCDTAALPWSFVDWGHDTEVHPNLPVLLHIVGAAQSWQRWQSLLGEPEIAPGLAARIASVRDLIARMLTEPRDFHSAVLAAQYGQLPAATVAAEVERHIGRAFPFNPQGVRHRSPTDVCADVATPYFLGYALPVLIEAGLADQVHQLWRTGWGWMLDRGATTWWEVFDDRWSRCHYWSGAPTWQMSRHLLGLWPVIRSGSPACEVRLSPGSLRSASGAVPMPSAGLVQVQWSRTDDTARMRLESDDDLQVVVGDSVLRGNNLTLSLARHRVRTWEWVVDQGTRNNRGDRDHWAIP